MGRRLVNEQERVKDEMQEKSSRYQAVTRAIPKFRCLYRFPWIGIARFSALHPPLSLLHS